MDDPAITCDEIIDAEAKLNDEEIFLYFTWLFINYHCIIDSR